MILTANGIVLSEYLLIPSREYECKIFDGEITG